MIKKSSKTTDSVKTCSSELSTSSIIWAAIGSFIGIYLIAVSNQLFHVIDSDHLFLVGSFAASAVLLFSAPKVNFAQPRNLIGGHILSAFVGVTIYKFVPLDLAITSALSVSLAIALMQLTRTIHPPGGATALIAVIGSSDIHELGYLYLLTPILVGILILLLVTLIISSLSKDSLKKYPKYWF